jgi:hypothetical protein
VIIFEIAMPFLFLNPATRPVAFLGAAAFHLGVFWLLGLNRFVWAWALSFALVMGHPLFQAS